VHDGVVFSLHLGILMPNASTLCLFVDRLGLPRGALVGCGRVRFSCGFACLVPSVGRLGLPRGATQASRCSPSHIFRCVEGKFLQCREVEGIVCLRRSGVIYHTQGVRMELDRHTEKSEELLASANQMASLRGSPNILQVL